MISDGTPWRPLVHALDICKAIVCTLEAPRDIIHNQIFNGDTTNNYQVKEIAEIIAEIFKDASLVLEIVVQITAVVFLSIKLTKRWFKCDWNARGGAQQMFELFTSIDMSESTFLSRGFTRLKQLEYLLRTQQIDKNFSGESSKHCHHVRRRAVPRHKIILECAMPSTP